MRLCASTATQRSHSARGALPNIAPVSYTHLLGTLFGMSLLSHQIGGFFGAYLGGVALTRFGDYAWMWYADIALAAAAALCNLPIREAALPRPAS